MSMKSTLFGPSKIQANTAIELAKQSSALADQAKAKVKEAEALTDEGKRETLLAEARAKLEAARELNKTARSFIA